MDDIFTVFFFFNLVSPPLAIVLLLKLKRVNAKKIHYTLIPSLVYVFGLYLLITIDHFNASYDPIVYQIPIRISISLLVLCLTIWIIAEYYCSVKCS